MMHAFILAHGSLSRVKGIARRDVNEVVLITSAAVGINYMRKSVL